MTALDNLNSNLSGDGGSATAYTNRVYLGTTGERKSRARRGRQQITYPAGDRTISLSQASTLYLTDEALRNSWLQELRKYGLDTDPIKARAIWDLSVAGASDWYATSNGRQKVTPQQYLAWYAGSQKKKGPSIPTRQIYDVPKAEVQAKIDKDVASIAGFEPSDEDRNQVWYKNLTKAINDMYNQGVVTTVKEVINPQTGKKEKQVIQKPGFSEEKMSSLREEAIRTANPEAVARKERVDFTKWLFSQGGQR
jgi:hypothetical protein